jgi:hypothetical protein
MISSEFQGLYPSAVRAFQLIALMYNRLTLVEKLSHKDALIKLYNDHRHLAGFSKRNISRNLPLDNPSVPRRVKPRWPKTSADEYNEPLKSSITIQEQDKKLAPKIYDCETGERAEEESSKPSLTDDVDIKDEECDILEFEFNLLKEDILQHLGEPYLWIRDGDCKVWFSGKIDKKSGHVISAKIGRINEQQNDCNNRGEPVQNE